VVTHFTVYGDNILKISSLNWFEDYYIVFDNTDKGWVVTNFDGINDYAVFNYYIYTIQ